MHCECPKGSVAFSTPYLTIRTISRDPLGDFVVQWRLWDTLRPELRAVVHRQQGGVHSRAPLSSLASGCFSSHSPGQAAAAPPDAAPEVARCLCYVRVRRRPSPQADSTQGHFVITPRHSREGEGECSTRHSTLRERRDRFRDSTGLCLFYPIGYCYPLPVPGLYFTLVTGVGEQGNSISRAWSSPRIQASIGAHPQWEQGTPAQTLRVSF